MPGCWRWTAAALAVPGVAAIAVAADIPGVNDIGAIFSGEPSAAGEAKSTYIGHPVAAVAATRPKQARLARRPGAESTAKR